ncbi:hypothetical protein SAMN06265365_103166 [Tistlia consotensis]|uniref:Uncharacterized protein n=1 Tax=Tistlia consotensis USBA 355 TaxID=560819 RepID=A0A1Y6BRT5_9PROT|nr:hypothetical protein [Tistlia consotensis]SMF16641.1 hypothetical protein SAMN05428998_10661 [Tistlia consotensis USBA 355]SNR40968.1 hypothetical protein SAMN06265365_103166 [Tistlia consotensis]
MSTLVFDSGEELPAAQIAQIRHRAAYVETLVGCLEDAPRLEPELYGSYDDWYLQALEDGLFRRVFVVEVREWRRHVEDLLRDQLTRNGVDSAWWDGLCEAPAASGDGEVERLRRGLAEGLGLELPGALWRDLEELVAVARTIAEGTRVARAVLQRRYESYFSDLDAFGDGDPGGRLTLNAEHARRAFAAVEAFWAALPYRVVGEGVA